MHGHAHPPAAIACEALHVVGHPLRAKYHYNHARHLHHIRARRRTHRFVNPDGYPDVLEENNLISLSERYPCCVNETLNIEVRIAVCEHARIRCGVTVWCETLVPVLLSWWARAH
jgi:hypothetical protein